MSVPTVPSGPGATLAGGDGTLGAVPGTVRQALILSRYQLRDYLRSRRFVLMISLVAIVGTILTTLVAYYRPAGLIDNANNFYGALWAGGATFLILFAGIIFGGDAIAGEFQNKTGYFLMGLPVKRTTVYAGKYLAVLMASVVSILVYLAIVIGNAAYYLGGGAVSDVGSLFASFALALLYLLALMGFVFLFSSLFKTSLYAVLVVAVMFLIGFSIIQGVVTSLTNTEPWFLLSYANSVIAYPLTGVPAHVVHSRFTGTTYYPTYFEGIAVMFGYFILTTIGGLFLFEREEFT
ncbi:MAG: ABC transporter permease [Thermoplasmata archaeon]|jgi:ABC-2 type transport system permease protein